MTTTEQITDNLIGLFSSSSSTIEKIYSDDTLKSSAYFCTLRHLPSSRTGSKEPLSSSAIDKNAHLFVRYLNQQIFKNAYKNWRSSSKHRRPKMKMLICTHEHHQQFRQNLSHLHIILIKPDDITEQELIDAVVRSWLKTDYGTTGIGDNQKMFDFQKVYSSGAVSYSLEQQKFYDSFTLYTSI